MPVQIFLSYSRRDVDVATKLARGLEKVGYGIWFDQTDIRTGSRWDDEIAKGLDVSQVFLVLLSHASTASQNVKDEIGYAIDRNKQILPVLLETCEVPFRLRRFQYVDLTNRSFSEGLQIVLRTLLSFQGESAPQTLLPPQDKDTDKSPGSIGNAGSDVVATNGSVSVGKLEIGGNLSGNIVIGNNNQVTEGGEKNRKPPSKEDDE